MKIDLEKETEPASYISILNIKVLRIQGSLTFLWRSQGLTLTYSLTSQSLPSVR